jgi:hypothetical protein
MLRWVGRDSYEDATIITGIVYMALEYRILKAAQSLHRPGHISVECRQQEKKDRWKEAASVPLTLFDILEPAGWG